MWPGRWSVVAVFFTVLGAKSIGADIQFDASVDRTRIGLTGVVRLTLSITSDEAIEHLPAPHIDLQKFEVIGPEISNSSERRIDLNAGVFESVFTRRLTYALYPRETGNFLIGPAMLELAGETYSTNSVTVEVVRSGRSRAQRSRTDEGRQAETNAIEDNLYIEIQQERERVFVGQQLTLGYELFYRYQLHNVGFAKIPAYEGFWNKDLFVAQKLEPRREVINGSEFHIDLLRQIAIFPTSAGRYAIEPLELSCEIAVEGGRRSVFDAFSFGRSTRKIVVRSPELTVEVLSLPQEGRPPGYSGAVGKFSMRAEAQPRQVKVGDPVTLVLEIGGEGHLAGIEAPDLSSLSGFKVYDPESRESEKIVNGRYGGSRAFEYILIAERSGALEVPAFSFPYFDPGLGDYRIARSAAMQLSSYGELPSEELPTYRLTRKDIEAVGQDIRHIKPDMMESPNSRVLYRSTWFWIFPACLPVVFTGLIVLRRHQSRLSGDVAYARKRRALGDAGKRLSRARSLAAETDSAAFFGEIHRALLAFVADRLNLSVASLNGSRCGELLIEKEIETAAVAKLEALLLQCDQARFGAARQSVVEMLELQESAERVIRELEKVL